ncbi:MAG: hypothetical protein U9Q69_06255 [Nanoarchaeota archaeon]|nr:hypothetical protein [Nanoarchaeota archaeon]
MFDVTLAWKLVSLGQLVEVCDSSVVVYDYSCCGWEIHFIYFLFIFYLFSALPPPIERLGDY